MKSALIERKDRAVAERQQRKLGFWADLKSQCLLGAEKFVEKIEPVLKDKSLLRQISRSRRLISRPSLDELIAPHEAYDKTKRNEALKKAHLEYGYCFAEIGRHVGLHYATVSRIVREKHSWNIIVQDLTPVLHCLLADVFMRIERGFKCPIGLLSPSTRE